jgi:cytochrome c oxidase subunit 2
MFDYFPENISTYGAGLDSVYWLIFYIVGFWFLLAEGVLLYFVVRYRRKANRRASYVSGETLRQASWILIPGAIVFLLDLGIDYAGAIAYNRFKDIPAADLVVEVKAKQFAWELKYPGPDGRLDTADDFSVPGELHVPVDKKIRLVLKAEDVLHAFFVPELRLKQDMIPGRSIPAWFEATKTGTYEIACAELCGFGHHMMRGFLVIHSESAYNAWADSAYDASQLDEWSF